MFTRIWHALRRRMMGLPALHKFEDEFESHLVAALHALGDQAKPVAYAINNGITEVSSKQVIELIAPLSLPQQLAVLKAIAGNHPRAVLTQAFNAWTKAHAKAISIMAA